MPVTGADCRNTSFECFFLSLFSFEVFRSIPLDGALKGFSDFIEASRGKRKKKEEERERKEEEKREKKEGQKKKRKRLKKGKRNKKRNRRKEKKNEKEVSNSI